MKRNPDIELYRSMLMFGIVLLHTALHAVVFYHWLQYAMDFCVTGFVFISGYYGMQFRLRKIFRLYATGVACVLIAGLTEVYFRQVPTVTAYLQSVFKHLQQCWFLHAYAALLLVVPMLNAALEKSGWELPFFFVAFGWPYLNGFAFFRPYSFDVAGFGSHTLMTLVGVYVAARLFRKYDVEQRVTIKTAALGAVVLFAFGTLGFSRYNSVFAFALSACLFVVFLKGGMLAKRSTGVAAKAILFMSQSLFSIYVLHNSDFNEALTSQLGGWLLERSGTVLGAIVISAFITYVLCLCADMIRRGLVALFLGWVRTKS